MDNFRQIFEFKESYQAIINTLIIAVSKIILGLIVPIIMALLLNEVHNIGLKKESRRWFTCRISFPGLL